MNNSLYNINDNSHKPTYNITNDYHTSSYEINKITDSIILLRKETRMRNRTCKQTNNICLQIELTANKYKFNQIVSKKTSILCNENIIIDKTFTNYISKNKSFLLTPSTPSQSQCDTSIERKTTQQLKEYSAICTIVITAQIKIDTQYTTSIQNNSNRSHPTQNLDNIKSNKTRQQNLLSIPYLYIQHSTKNIIPSIQNNLFLSQEKITDTRK